MMSLITTSSSAFGQDWDGPPAVEAFEAFEGRDETSKHWLEAVRKNATLGQEHAMSAKQRLRVDEQAHKA